MKISRIIFLGALISLWLSVSSVWSQSKPNIDESAVPSYELPDPLVTENGDVVVTKEQWCQFRRKEILELFSEQVFGKVPSELKFSSSEILEESDTALDHTAIRKQIALHFKKNGKEITIHLLIYLPKAIHQPPVFIGYNFYGNQTIDDDPAIFITREWVKNNPDILTNENKATESSRGKRSHRWPVKMIIDAGFGIATMYYGDVDPDKNDLSDGVQSLLYDKKQTTPEADEWGSIAAWAWGMSQALDYLKEESSLKNSKFIAIGHSRLGKTALWAGANDERFDMVISNNSGCGGAALFRREFGETAGIINKNFPYWFCGNFHQYSDNEHLLPVDQHMLISLIAPRPVYIASAADDLWADPKGEYLSGYHASPVFQLFGKEGLNDSIPPAVDTPVHNTIGYHKRSGGHDITPYDWRQFIAFAKMHWK